MERHVMMGYASLPVRTRGRARVTSHKPRRWLPEDRFERANAIGAFWSMVAINVALFIAPGVNGFVAGWTGSAGLGGPGRTLRMALPAAVLSSLGLSLILGPLGLPILGLYPGVGASEAVLLSGGGLLLAAWLRGLLTWARAVRVRARARA
ncbi:hypothetical protein ACLESD_51220 [Pyxidicoccus sp. 3LFB2]